MHQRTFLFSVCVAGNRNIAARSTAVTTTRLTVSTTAGTLVIPKAGTITFNGRESKIIVTDYVFGANRVTSILYSTAESVACHSNGSLALNILQGYDMDDARNVSL